MALKNISSPTNIFRAYDIRGIYGKDIDEAIMHKIGYVFGLFATTEIVVGHDCRTSSPSLAKAFTEGCQQSGKNITSIGLVPISVAKFYAWRMKKNCAYITASHLAKEWNGVKLFYPNGMGFSEEDTSKIKELFLAARIKPQFGEVLDIGSEKPREQYVNFLLFKMQPKKKLKIVFDAGNGAASLVSDMFEKAGHEVIRLFCDLDGKFPNRLPSPQEDKLDVLRKTVVDKNADVGFAFDGDADRLVVVSEKGDKLTSEQFTYVVLLKLLKNKTGTIVVNVESTKLVDDTAKQFNCSVVRVPVGDMYLVKGVYDNNAVFGTEVSGHTCIPLLVPFDDAIAAAYFISCNLEEKVSDIVKTIPKYPFERVNIPCMDEMKFRVTERLKKKLSGKYKNINTMDGIRIDFENAWVLIRPSNTEPKIRLTIEAQTKEELATLKQEFSDMIKKEIEY